MKLWQFMKQQYDFIIRTAGTPLATRLMVLYAALESIIIPIPVDPLLVAVVLAKSNQWRQIAFACTVASVIGGAGGWALGAYLGLHIQALIDSFPVALAAPSAFATVEAGFAEFGLVLVFLGAFSPLPYKVIAVSAGIGGFANDRSREFFAHRDQLYVFRRASGTVAGGGNAFLHCGQVIGNLRHAGMLV